MCWSFIVRDEIGASVEGDAAPSRRHPRQSGDPRDRHRTCGAWVPALAGMTKGIKVRGSDELLVPPWILAGLLLLVLASFRVAAQPADCPSMPPSGPMLPLSLDLAGRPGVPRGVTGQAYVYLPMGAPGVACDNPPPPRDVLRGEPLMGPPSADLLRGPGTPRVWVETR